MTNNNNTNIILSIDIEEDYANEPCDDDIITNWLSENLEKVETVDICDDNMFSHMVDYTENYTVKQLLSICDYYGFAKELKINRYNKEQIVSFLVVFESEAINADIVCRRKNMWFYLIELKTDKFMKKYVL